jgi:hypothetical protein
MLLWLVCRGDASVISRISSSALGWDFQVDVYPWGEVDVWISGIPSLQSPPWTTSNGHHQNPALAL